MIKIIGSAFIFFACVYVGFMKSICMRRREECLMNVNTFLNMLDIQIQFSTNRIELCMRAADKHIRLGRLLTYTADHIRTDGIQKSWSDSVAKNTPYLTAEDRQILSSLGAQLGMTDRENQYKNICCTKNLIDKQYQQARAIRERTSKLYEGGGMLAGAFAILLLI